MVFLRISEWAQAEPIPNFEPIPNYDWTNGKRARGEGFKPNTHRVVRRWCVTENRFRPDDTLLQIMLKV